MDETQTATPRITPGRLRAGDAERDATVADLRAHHEAGRLSAEEFDERMSTALSARWRDELPPLFADLPDERPAGPPDVAPDGWGRTPWRGGRRRGPWVPLVPLLAVLGTFASIGAVAHGRFPWAVLWIGVLVAFLHVRGRRRWAAARR